MKNKEDIMYISEDLFGETHLARRYEGMVNLKALIAAGFGKVENMEKMFYGCKSLVDISSLSA